MNMRSSLPLLFLMVQLVQFGALTDADSKPKIQTCEMSPVTSSKVNRKSTLDVRHYSAVLTGCKVK